MIPVLGFAVLNQFDRADRLLASIDYPVEHLVVVNNSGKRSFMTRIFIRSILTIMTSSAGWIWLVCLRKLFLATWVITTVLRLLAGIKVVMKCPIPETLLYTVSEPHRAL